jgi:hypothetical protein
MNQPFLDLDDLVERWTLEGHRPAQRDEAFKDLLLQLEFLAKRSFSRFVPALFPPYAPGFLDRLMKWLSNEDITSEQQRLLFQFALRIAYISFEDFLLLYRSAFVGPVTRWIIDEVGITLQDLNFATRLDRERKRHTWYCPITDSMVISEFYHANGITGIDQRPAFRPLTEFCDPKLISDYMADYDLQRLVLMEDFVGTGTQAFKVVKWAVEKLKCPILFIPLVICPEGVQKFAKLADQHRDRLRVEPVLELDDSVFVLSDVSRKDQLITAVGNFAKTIHPKIVGDPDTTFGPFGFGDTGATVVLFSNTPDNTLPLIHHHSRAPAKWQALFPRVSRETL